MTQNGTLEYTARAYGMDAKEAMRGRLDRALVELITNSDDAYGDLSGEIKLSVSEGQGAFSSEVGVYDSATGLTADEMVNAFTKLGGKRSNLTKGGSSRGLLGRGAKDVAVFGKVVFLAIKNGKYSELEIANTAKWQLLQEDVAATPAHYERLKLAPQKNGLAAIIHIVEKRDLPKPNDLTNSLKNTAQLRDLILRRSVSIADYRQLTSAGRIVSTLEVGVEVLNVDFSLEGHDGTAKLIIRKLSEPQVGLVNEMTAHGLLIKSDMTVFQNTWFDLGNRPAARLLSGEVIAPQIVDELRRELTDDYVGSVSLLTRNRDGLQKDHQLFKKLKKEVTQLALGVFEEVAATGQEAQRQGAALDKALKAAGESIKADLLMILRDLDDEQPVGDPIDELSEFEAIPGILVVAPGTDVTVTLRAKESLAENDLLVENVGDAVGLVLRGGEFGKAYPATWKDHPRLDRFVAQCRISAPWVNGVYELRFTMGGQTSTLQLVVRPDREKLVPPPVALEFYPPLVTASPKRGKNMLLRAPLDFAHETVRVAGANLQIEAMPESVVLLPNAEGSWCEAIVHVKTSQVEGELLVVATASTEVRASGTLRVKESGTRGVSGPMVNFELSGELDTVNRFAVEKLDDTINCMIFGQHRGFGGVFGAHSEELGKFMHEDTAGARAVLAEVIALAVAEYLLEIDFSKNPTDRWDPSATISKIKKYADRIVGKLHRALVSEGSV